MNHDEQELLNKYYWSFIYLITKNPEQYLTKKGKILYHLVLNGGQFNSITMISKKMNQHLSITSIMCRQLVENGHVTSFKENNRKVVIFDKQVIEEALKITYSMAKDNGD